MKLSPQQAMALAIEEGRKGAGFVSPNPLVGCVILSRDHELLAQGHHARVGDAHAEINALKSITDRSRLNGAHVYVTLEPCAHKGRTGSCAKHLAGLPIASVTYGLEDPNPLVSGKGAEILRSAGKRAERFTELQGELEDLAEIFLMNMREKRPFVALKIASSLDGQVALADGQSQWITGVEAREHVQFLRGCYDAVLTGVGTIKKDNPRLNSRDPRFKNKTQIAVVLDPRGELRFSGLKLLEVRRPQDVIWVTGPDVTVDPQGVRQVRAPIQDGRFDLRSLLAQLKEVNIHSLMVEAGPMTNSAFLSADLVDRLDLFVAPKVLGGGLSWTSDLKIPSLGQALRLSRLKMRTFGEDFLISGRLLWS